MEELYEIKIKNEILGNSKRVMSMGEIEKFNVCAALCAKASKMDGKAHTMGMWTVRKIKS